jgi:competence protein ComEC
VWLDPLLMCALSLCAGATLVVAPGAALLALGFVLWLLWSRTSWGVRVALLLCLVLGGLRAHFARDAFDRERAAARDAFGPPQRCALTGRIDSSPTWAGSRAIYVLRVSEAQCELGAIEKGARVRLNGGPDDFARGDRVAVVAQLAPIELLFNLDLADPLASAARRRVTLSGTALHAEREARGLGLATLIDRARASVRRRITASFAPAVEAMARALVLGENDLDPDDDAAFRKSGLSHMLAVSGTHLVFAVVTLVQALGALLVRVERLSARCDAGRIAALCGVGLSLLYADFAGGSGSAFRAAYMLSAALLARAFGRLPCASRALGASLGLGWLVDGLVVFDISFLLSAAATTGLLLLGEPLRRPCEQLNSRVGRWLGGAIATTLAAMIPCAPLLALLGSDITLAGILANVLAAPLGEAVALPLCLVHMFTAPLRELESGIALVASGALLVVRAIARESAAQRWLAVPVPDPTAYHLALFAAVVGKLVLARGGERTAFWLRWWLLSGGLGLLVVELAVRRAGAPHGVLRMTALSVGQGDSTLIDLPDGKLMLIDGGGAPDGGADPGARVVLPTLRARRRARLDVVVLTHPHPDHFGGLVSVLRNVEVGELWDSGQGALEGAGPVYAELLKIAAERGVRVLGPKELCGAPRRFGDGVVSLLAPCPGIVRGRNANDNSLVLKARLGERAFLFMGDAEMEEERELVSAYGSELRANVLKVGHHGSRTSSSEPLLAAVAPELATVSCGVRNRFGHPVPMVMQRIESHGTHALRTDRDGAIQISNDGSALNWAVAYAR